MWTFKTKKLVHAPIKKEEILDTPLPSSPAKRKFWIRFFLGIAIMLATVLFGYVFATNLMNKNEWNMPGSSHTFSPIISGDFLSAKKEWTINILIAGIWGKWHDGSDLTDSIMLASINRDEKKITLLSIPRDLYVAYPEQKWAGKINSLYSLGNIDKVWVKYLADKVSEITGQEINHYVIIDFSGFKKIIDILWWIEVDVPEDLIDREYPDDNWGYETLVVRKWLQTMDGDLALKYARSRHSTSDFDRSVRQQLIIKAIKDKLFGASTITSPTKVGDLFAAVMDHLDTDLSLTNMAEMAFGLRTIQNDNITIFSLTNECGAIKTCLAGSYLYTPSRELFWWASVIIPENARINKLSYYDDIRRFVDISFRYPELRKSTDEIVIISTKSQSKKAQSIAYSLKKLGFPLSSRTPLYTATGEIMTSHVNIYWHEDVEVGINPKTSMPVSALKYLEEWLQYNTVPHNEYINTDGPKIEIVLGDDIENYFPFITPVYYIPEPPPTVTSWEVTTSGKTTSPVSMQHPTMQNPSSTPSSTNNTSDSIQPWQWEDFGN